MAVGKERWRHDSRTRYVRLHYNWKYKFLRPTVDAIVTRYNQKWHDGEPLGDDPNEAEESDADAEE